MSSTPTSCVSAGQLFAAGIVVPLSVSTFLTLVSPVCSFLPFLPSHFGILLNRPLTLSPSGFQLSYLPTSLATSRDFVVGPGYSLVPFKLASKICSGLFTDFVDLLLHNLKANETFLEGKLVVTPSKKCSVEISGILTWAEAFSSYSLVLQFSPLQVA